MSSSLHEGPENESPREIFGHGRSEIGRRVRALEILGIEWIETGSD